MPVFGDFWGGGPGPGGASGGVSCSLCLKGGWNVGVGMVGQVDNFIKSFLCVLKFVKKVYQIGFFIIFAAEIQIKETNERGK